MPWEQSSTFRGNMYPGFALSFRKEKTMSDPIGWLWAILVVLGVGGLGFTIDAYDSAKILGRRQGTGGRRRRPHASFIEKKNLVGEALRPFLS